MQSVVACNHQAGPGNGERDVTETAADGIVLAPGPTAPRSARWFVAQWCAQHGLTGDAVDTLLLLTCELVTNAVVYGRSDVSLALASADRSARRVRISVGDENTRLPQWRDADPAALNGRGLVLVEALAERHGIDVTAAGKTVWCDVEVPGRQPAATSRRTPSGCGTHRLSA